MKTLTPHEEQKLIVQLCHSTHSPNAFTSYLDAPYWESLRFKHLRNALAAVIMLDAGLRVGELVQLTIPDVYFERKPVNSIHVRPTIAKMNHGRDIPLPERCKQILHYYRLHIDMLTPAATPPPLLTGKPQGHALTPRTIERIITAAGEAALGFPVNPHMLRHTYATKLMSLTNMRTIQELLGHKHISSTQIYTHVTDDDKRQAISALSAAAAAAAP